MSYIQRLTANDQWRLLSYHSTMPRVGDYIDDYCSRCKFSSDHVVVSMVGDEVKKVLCRTCNTEHNYRGNKGSKEMTAKDAWNKLFASVSGPAAAEPAKKKSRSKK
jgi:hypothetical protein